MKIWVENDTYDDEETEFDSEPVEDLRESDHSARDIILAVLFETAFAVPVYLKAPDALLNYLTALAPMLAGTVIFGMIASRRNANMKLFRNICILASIGIGLQLVIDEVYQPDTSFEILKYYAAFAIALILMIFMDVLRKVLKYTATMYIMFTACAAIYIALALYGYDANGYGTVAWISIHGYSLQLTEFSKVAALLFYSSLFSGIHRSDETYVLSLSSLFLLMNLAGSVYIHELGSFFILFVLHIALLAIFLEHTRRKRTYLLIIIGLCVFTVGACFAIYKLLLPYYNTDSLNAVTAYIWPIVKKVYERFSITANINNDPYGAGYQLLQGKKAMWMAGLFGNTVNFSAIPVAESDMAFIAMVCEFGWLLGFFVMFLLSRITVYACMISNRLFHTERESSVLVFGIAVMFFMQAVIVILGSANVIPFTGLPIPFLSRGGTYQTIVFCFMGILLRTSEKREEVTEDELWDEEQQS